MLTESFVAATLNVNPAAQHLSAALKDVGIFHYEIQPQTTLRQGYKKSSTQSDCLAVSRSHIYAAQNSKAVINVYNREKNNQESTVPFPERIQSVAYAHASEVLILGTEDGKLLLWEVGTGRISTSTASHIQGISHLQITPHNDLILSGSPDTTVQVWSLSRLLSFPSPGDAYLDGSAANSPLSTFTAHRSPIAALTCGHSQSSTNFAVSASTDATCHIWHIETCQVLRTVLLSTAPTCIAIDPADRAVYLGDASGSIAQIDVIELGRGVETGMNGGTTPRQILEKHQWRPSSDPGSMHCLAVSFDGTFLLSGHSNGSILRWDAAKHKIAAEVSKIGQPVTNLQMLRPDGIEYADQPDYDIPEIVKPRLDFNVRLDTGSSNIPAGYKLHAALRGRQRLDEDGIEGVPAAMVGDGWPESVIDAAFQSLTRGAAETHQSTTTLHQSEALRAENVGLKRSVDAYKDAELARMDRSIQRMAKREDVDLKRRQAYHQAVKLGKDRKAANTAMQAIDTTLNAARGQIDAESDADAFDGMDTHGS